MSSRNPHPGACEWDPALNRPAQYVPGGGAELYTGCLNPATIILGSRTTWRLCEQCAKLPKFKLLRKHIHIQPALVWEVWQGDRLICSKEMGLTQWQARNKVDNERKLGIHMEARPA